MRGWTSYFIGTLLLAIAIWSYSSGGFSSTTILFGALALLMFFRGANGEPVTGAEDIMAPMEFIQNPAEAIVEAAVDKVGEMFGGNEDNRTKDEKGAKQGKGVLGTAAIKVDQVLNGTGEKDAQGSAFDPDAVIQRYLATRAEPITESAPVSVRPQFGRKGL